jgi:hypothetical protein
MKSAELPEVNKTRHERPPSAGSRAAQLRNDIDHGQTGDKVDWPDPAAAPLGTDDEAAGGLPPAESIQKMRREEYQSGQAGPRRPLLTRSFTITLAFVLGIMIVWWALT